MSARRRSLAAVITLGIAIGLSAPPPAQAFNPLKPFCKVAQLGSGAVGKACGLVSSPGKLLKAGGRLATGHVGGALKALGGSGASAGSASAKLGLAAVVAWVLGGATFALHETGRLLVHTTSPRLQSTWFSSIYWRMAAIAALLTLPFLCAAALQAVISGDLMVLGRAAFGYLPLAFLAVAIAAPVTMLLLAASDQLSAAVGSAGGSGLRAVVTWGTAGAILAGLAKASPFVAFLIGAVAAGGALVLWLELLMREAAVYIVVMMLPLAFAALVWPARRVWALRAVELLVALILAKFAIVAVLALGGAALTHISGISSLLAGVALVLLGAFAPWAVLRLIPVTEIATGAAGALRPAARAPVGISAQDGDIRLTGQGREWADALTAALTERAPDPVDEGRNGNGRPGSRERPLLAGGVLERAPAPEPEPEPPKPSGSAEPVETGLPTGSAPQPATEGSLATQPSRERSPGLAPMWQAPDLSWPTLVLGLEGDWPPRVWPPDHEGDQSRLQGGDDAIPPGPEGEL